ncbi:MAG: glycosyltransferase [Chloroflexota bacterium]
MNQPEGKASEALVVALRAYIRRQEKMLEALRGSEPAFLVRQLDERSAELKNALAHTFVLQKQLATQHEQLTSLEALFTSQGQKFAEQTAELQNELADVAVLQARLSPQETALAALAEQFDTKLTELQNSVVYSESLAQELQKATRYSRLIEEQLSIERDALNQLRSFDTARADTLTLTQSLASRDTELRNAQIYLQALEQTLHSKDEAYHYLSTQMDKRLEEIAVFRNSRLIRWFVRPVWKLRHQFFASRAAQVGQAEQTSVALNAFSLEQTAAGTLPSAAPVSVEPFPIQPGSTIIFTIISKNYLASARVLMQSIQQYHPNIALVVVLVDEVNGDFDPAQEPFHLFRAVELGIHNWSHFSMKYDIMELNTAVKPYAMRLFMERYDAQKVIYFDPDIAIYHSLDPLLELLDRYLCVLTPHITHSLDDDRSPGELDFLRVGTFNLGFFALSKRDGWHRLLRWWEDKLYENCTREIERGLFVDQHWMDLVPSLFNLVYILRDPGYNVAYWNLSGREIARDPSGSYTVNGQPLIFFHFSGFWLAHPELVSKHQNRFSFDNLNSVSQSIFLEYRRALLDAGYETVSNFAYAYGTFADGAPIPDTLRICLRSYDNNGSTWANPFEITSPDSFRRWATAPGVIPPFRLLSPLALTLYQLRTDLRVAFPDVAGKDETAYANWFVQQNFPADLFDSVYVDPMRQLLDSPSEDTRPITAVAYAQPDIPQSRLDSTIRYFRRFPSEVKPYLPPEAFLKPPNTFLGPQNFYGRVRSVLQRTGVLQTVRQVVGLRVIMSARHYSSYDPVGTPFSPPVSNISLHPPAFTLPARPSEDDSETKFRSGMQVVGYLRAETGVGQVARNLLMSVQAVGIPASGYMLDVHDTYRQEDHSLAAIDDHLDYLIQIFNVNADQAMPTYQALGDAFYQGHYNIGYWFWELSQFPAQWNNAFDVYDEIWVATRFVRDAVQAKTNKRVTHVPVSIEVPLPAESSRSQLGLPDASFLVLVMFDALSIVERKNPWGAIEAFSRAFSPSERQEQVRLVVKVNNLEKVPDADRLRAAVRGVNGILIEQYLDRLDANALIQQCDVYLSLHRSEGYGLAMAEAMYLGKPVIATAYSGNVDFMNESNSYLVPYTLVELSQSYPPYEAHNVWADPDIKAAARLLRQVFDVPEEAKRKGSLAARYIRDNYNNQVVGQQIALRLNEILIAQGYEPFVRQAETHP